MIYFAMTALVVVLGAGGAFMMFSGNSDKQAEIAKLKQDARDPKEMEQELEAVKAEATANAEKLAHLEKGITEIAYVPTMLKELESFGNKNGILVTGVRPVPKVEVKGKEKKARTTPYEELTIEIKGKGKYRAVMQFVAALKTFPKIVAARNVALTPKNGQAPLTPGSAPNLEATIELRAFMFKPLKSEMKSKGGEESDPSEAAPASAPTQGSKTAMKETRNEG